MATQQITEARGVVLESSGSPTGFVLQIITPGIGSSGYYSADVLEAAVAENVFPKGTHLYIDHPSQSESQDRPERSIRDLAGSTTGDAVWNPITQAVEATCRVYPGNAWIKDVAEDIGMSIRASADVSESVIEGRKMPVINRLVEAFSVDFVTKAGRGGKVLAAIESHRDAINLEGEVLITNTTGGVSAETATASVGNVADLAPVIAGGQSSTVEETLVPPIQEFTEVAEATRRVEAAEARATAAEAERDQLRAQIAERDNRDAAVARVSERVKVRLESMPAVKARVIEAVTRILPMKDGALDLPALDAEADRVVEAEVAYIQSFLTSGTVSGHGQTEPVAQVDDHVAAEAARTRVPFTRPTVRN